MKFCGLAMSSIITNGRFPSTDGSCTSDMVTVPVANVVMKPPRRKYPKRPGKIARLLKNHDSDDAVELVETKDNAATESGNLCAASGIGYRWIEDIEFRPFHTCPACGTSILRLVTDAGYTSTSDIFKTVTISNDSKVVMVEAPRRKDPERPKRTKRSMKNPNRDDVVETLETDSNAVAGCANLLTGSGDGFQRIVEMELRPSRTCPTCGAMLPALHDSRFHENQLVPLKECCSFLRNIALATFMLVSFMASLYIVFFPPFALEV